MQTNTMVGGGSWATSHARKRWGDWWNRIVRLMHGSEPVEICAHRYGYQPQRFRWHGVIMRVGRVEQVWEQTGRNSRRYFRVLCQNDRTYTLYQDLQLGAWYVESGGTIPRPKLIGEAND